MELDWPATISGGKSSVLSSMLRSSLREVKAFQVRKKDNVCPLKGKLLETDEAELDVVSVSSGSSVAWCPAAFPETLLHVFPCEGEFTCRPCEPHFAAVSFST